MACSPTRTVDPTAKWTRSSSSTYRFKNSSRPWGRPRRATLTGSVDELNAGDDPFLFAGSCGGGANRLGDAAPAPDDATEITLGGADLGNDLVGPLLDDVDDDLVLLDDDAVDEAADAPDDHPPRHH